MNLNNFPTLGGVVDRLAIVKQQIADLKAEESALKDVLATSGESIVEGMFHRAAISEVASKPCIDWRAIAEHFNPSRQLVTAHTTYSEAYTCVRVSARKTS